MMLITLVLPVVLTSVEVKRLDEKHDMEVAAEAVGVISAELKEPRKKFEHCVPRESRLFEGDIPKEWEESIFGNEALKDMMKCTPKDCAFNFLPFERHRLATLKKPEEVKKFYHEAYRNRAEFKVGTDPDRSKLFIRSKDQAFSICQGQPLADLLNQRPLKGKPFRISHVQYHKHMRQTTRLGQGFFWETGPQNKEICYAESLVFSDHYDVDRVEVWNLKENRLTLQIRHRIDLLNSWIRRLNKGKFRKEVESIAERDMKDALACMNGAK